MSYRCGEIIKELCRSHGITVKKFETDLGFANGYVGMMARQGTRPKEDRLRLIANYFNVTPEYILGDPTAETSTGGVMIPLLGRVAAGIPISAVENVIGQEEISQKMASTGEYFALKIKGDSMSPYIMDGDIVIVRQQDDAESDEIVIALINGSDGVCKRLKKSEKALTLVSLNPSYTPMVYTLDEVADLPVRILGKVVEIRRTV